MAQTAANARLDVAVHDLQGNAVPQASVTLQAPPGAPPAGGKFTPRAAETDDSGVSHFTDVAPGRYRLSIKAKSFDELATDVDVSPPEDAATAISATRIEAILTAGATRTDSITVQGVIDTPLEEANTPAVLERQQVKDLPDRPFTVTDALPLTPGIVRLPSGELMLSGSGEHRSALLVNSVDHDRSGDGAVRSHGADRQRTLDDHPLPARFWLSMAALRQTWSQWRPAKAATSGISS